MGDFVAKLVDMSTFGATDLYKAPRPPRQVTMPDEEELKRARRKKVAARRNRGRTSTILSEGNKTDQLGPG